MTYELCSRHSVCKPRHGMKSKGRKSRVYSLLSSWFLSFGNELRDRLHSPDFRNNLNYTRRTTGASVRVPVFLRYITNEHSVRKEPCMKHQACANGQVLVKDSVYHNTVCGSCEDLTNGGTISIVNSFLILIYYIHFLFIVFFIYPPQPTKVCSSLVLTWCVCVCFKCSVLYVLFSFLLLLFR